MVPTGGAVKPATTSTPDERTALDEAIAEEEEKNFISLANETGSEKQTRKIEQEETRQILSKLVERGVQAGKTVDQVVDDAAQ